MDQYLVVAITLIVASITQALTGFGFSLILLPVLMFFYSAHEAIIISLMLTLFSYSLMLCFIYRHVNFRIVLLMFLMSLPGIYLGSILFGLISALLLRYFVGIITILFSLFLLFQPSSPLHNERIGAILAGFLSGFLSSLMSTPGPPIVLFAVNQNFQKEEFRASLGAFFLAVTPISILVHLYSNSGLVLPLIINSFSMIPVIILGNVLGLWLFPYIPGRYLRNMALSILFILGLSTLFFK